MKIYFQKLKIVEVTRKSYGRFFDGDAYIIYSASPSGQIGGPNFKVALIKIYLVTIFLVILTKKKFANSQLSKSQKSYANFHNSCYL